jgi:hypothetical protein
MKELLIVTACMMLPVYTLKGYSGVRDISQMHLEIEDAHRRARIALPPPNHDRVVSRDDGTCPPGTTSGPATL